MIIPKDVVLDRVITLGIKKNKFLRSITAIKSLTKDFRYLINFLNILKFQRNVFNLSLLEVAKALKGTGFDIIHSHFGNNGLLISQLKKAGQIRGKIVTHFHGLDFTSPKYHGTYYKDLINYGDINIAVTRFSQKKLVALGFRETSIRVLPVGTSTSYFSKKLKVIENEFIYILSIGRFIELKGVSLLPQVLDGILRKGFNKFKIIVVGDGPLKTDIELKTQRFKGFIEFKGRQNSFQIRKLMAIADIYLYLGIEDSEGRVENQCVTIQEASSMELPVIASDIGGVPESVIDNYNGLLFPPHEINSIVEKILHLARDKGKRLELGKNGRAQVKRNYELAKCNLKLLELYEEIIP